MTALSTAHGASRAAPRTGQETVAFAAATQKRQHRRRARAAAEPGIRNPMGAPAEPEVKPLRSTAAELREMFGTADAGTPQWHLQRAAALREEASVHPVAAVSNAYCRLASRHLATARLLDAALRRQGEAQAQEGHPRAA
jgi:hypothetical protein